MIVISTPVQLVAGQVVSSEKVNLLTFPVAYIIVLFKSHSFLLLKKKHFLDYIDILNFSVYLQLLYTVGAKVFRIADVSIIIDKYY